MAFLAPAMWEVRTTGSDANAGGFDAVSGVPGSDFSQQTAAQISYTDLKIDATTNTKCSSVAFPFTAVHVGNFITITGPAGFTTQIVQILSVAAGVATCDKSLGTLNTTGGTGKLGGCFANISKAAGLAVSGNTVWIRATANYSVVSNTSIPAAAGIGTPSIFLGYATTRGDAGKATVQAAGSGGFTIFTLNGNNILANLILDGANKATVTGILFNASAVVFSCKIMNMTVKGIDTQGGAPVLWNVLATGCSGTVAFDIEASTTLGECQAIGNTTLGFRNNGAAARYIRCISANNTGATSDGFQQLAGVTLAGSPALVNCVAYGNGRDGLRLASETGEATLLLNCIFALNAGYGINSAAGTTPIAPTDCSAFYGNTLGARNAFPAGTHDVTLTADPFTNGAAADFSLNATAGAGAACRAAGFPGTLQAGGTGYIDIGALQHPDPTGTSGGGMAMSRVRSGF